MQTAQPAQGAARAQSKPQEAKAILFALEPDPVQVCDGSPHGIVTVRWNTAGVSVVEVHVNAPDGPLLTRSGPGSASKTTGKWVHNGMKFFLQNASTGSPLTPASTLATTQANVTSKGCPQTDVRVTMAGTGAATASPRGGVLRGVVVDQAGSLVVGAAVTVSDSKGLQRGTTTDLSGAYVFRGLPPGVYEVKAQAEGFAPFRKTGLSVADSRPTQQDVRLAVALKSEGVTVEAEKQLSVEPTGGLGTLVLRGKALNALPSNQRALVAALRALAVPSAGVATPPIIVDGFPGGRFPPKESIREVRISENPFAAEYDKPGYGRIEIYTKPGTEDFKFGTSFNFNDESLNSRDPFAPARAASQSRQFGLTVSGPVRSKRSSFFFDLQRQSDDTDAVVNATVLDDALRVTPFATSVATPERDLILNPRLDYQLNRSNTLVARYSFTRSRAANFGVGAFTLPSAGYSTFDSEQSVQLTETAVLSPNALNELRFQFASGSKREQGDNSQAAVEVRDAFTGGGSPVGLSFTDERRWELQDYLMQTSGRHSLKYGAQLRGVRLGDSSDRNFNGTFVFGGADGPLLDAADNVVRGARGQAVIVPLTSIETYRRTLAFARRGMTPAQISDLGGGPSQLWIVDGDRLARVSQFTSGLFAQDDWQLRQNLTLSLGLRYEWQTNVRDRSDLAPRVSFAWAPGGGSSPKTILRGGFGLFYDRVGEELTLQARHSDGLRQFIVTDPDVLGLFPNVPTRAVLDAFATPQTIYSVARDTRAPYSLQSSFSFETQLPAGVTFAATYGYTRTLHLLRARDINAPLPGTYDHDFPEDAVRPFGNVGERYSYESSGNFRQHQLSLNVTRNSKLLTFYATYVYNRARGDTDGSDTFPADSYDLRSEYGRSALDVRHSFYLGGWFTAPFGIDVYPLLFARSGVPFNITTGRDLNGDALFAERPALATDLTRASVVRTPYGNFDLDPLPGQRIIPRNFGQGPAFFAVNLTLSKTISLREGGGKDGATGKRPLSMTVGMQVENLLNRVNLDRPVGDLSSPYFGRSLSAVGPFGTGGLSSGNRRVELQVSFNF